MESCIPAKAHVVTFPRRTTFGDALTTFVNTGYGVTYAASLPGDVVFLVAWSKYVKPGGLRAKMPENVVENYNACKDPRGYVSRAVTYWGTPPKSGRNVGHRGIATDFHGLLD